MQGSLNRSYIIRCSPKAAELGNGSITGEEMFVKLMEQQTLLISELTKRTPGDVKPEATSGHMKLSPLKIPNFCGEYKDWTSFHDIFKTAIHKNERLSNAQ